VDYYLAHSERRQEIADAGYSRAHRDHTYQVRMQRMLGVIYRPDGQALPASGQNAK